MVLQDWLIRDEVSAFSLSPPQSDYIKGQRGDTAGIRDDMKMSNERLGWLNHKPYYQTGTGTHVFVLALQCLVTVC